MNVNERDLYRLNILKKLCEKTDYNINVQVGQTKVICDLFDIKTNEEYSTLLGAIQYLTQKRYIDSKIIQMMGGNTQIFMIQLTAYGLDVIESIERKTSTEKYENDFSKDAIVSLGNVNNSTVIINSPGVTINIKNIIEKIEQFPEELLLNSEKKDLCNKIMELTEKKDKSSKWEKSKEILKIIAEKSFDVGVAILPVLVESLL